LNYVQLKDSIFIYLFIAIIFFPVFSVSGVLTENGTRTDGNITVVNRSYILNQTYADFIRNLTMIIVQWLK